MSKARPVGSCKHRPISNGWSSHWSAKHGQEPAITWCGHCKAYIEIDAEWAAKFVAHGKTPPTAFTTPTTSRPIPAGA